MYCRNALWIWMLGSKQGRYTADWCSRSMVHMKNPGHSLHDCQKCRHTSHCQPATAYVRHYVPSSHFLWASCTNDASQAIFEPPAENWRRPLGRRAQLVHDDLSSLDLGIYEARHLMQNRPLWRPWCLCTALRTSSGACYYWIGL